MSSEVRQKINDFIESLKKDYGFLPKWNYSGSAEKLYYNTPYMDNREISAGIEALLFSNWIAAGNNIKEFEDEYSKLVKNKYTITCSSGSDADLMMICALKEYFSWSDFSNILISVAGFPTTYSAVTFNNLTCNFVDIEEKTLNFDLDKLESQINKDTVAIFVSPPLGNLPDMDRLVEISKKHNLVLVNDGCDSSGSTFNGKLLNEYGIATSCSFYMAHHLSLGAGGSVSTDNKKLADIVRSLSRWGHNCWCRGEENLLPLGKCNSRHACWIKELDDISDHKYTYFRPGFNSQLLDLQGAIGLEQIKKALKIHQKRKNSQKMIRYVFEQNIPKIKFPEVLSGADISWFGTCLICPNKEFKQKLVQYLEKHGIQTRDFFGKNILTQPGFQKFGNWKDFPVANDILYRLFFVGANPNYTTENFAHLEKVLQDYNNE